MNITQTNNMSKDDELVLVVPSSILFEQGKWHGLLQDNLERYIELIKGNSQFKRRGDVENDNSFQQIIPYILFSARSGSASGGNDKYFVYKYLPEAGEPRLVDTYQLGVAGHINPIDDNKENILEEAMMREWNEEVDYKGHLLSKRLVGIINDEAGMVESVHIGLVYIFVGDSQDINIKETEKMAGQMVDLEEVKSIVTANPNSVWMNIVYRDYLSKL